jgi:hypothetical protein
MRIGALTAVAALAAAAGCGAVPVAKLSGKPAVAVASAASGSASASASASSASAASAASGSAASGSAGAFPHGSHEWWEHRIAGGMTRAEAAKRAKVAPRTRSNGPGDNDVKVVQASSTGQRFVAPPPKLSKGTERSVLCNLKFLASCR